MTDTPGVGASDIPNHSLDDTGYCLLSLDGGGVRGLSTLYILRGIMQELNDKRRKNGLSAKKPCELFNMIGGTSTGGLIAIMLGRLEMSVDECIEAYATLMERVFNKRENRTYVDVFRRVQPRFSSKALENAIVHVLKTKQLNITEKFDDTRDDEERCKVFVCANFQKTSTTTRLRSYYSPKSTFEPTILEAALATTAAPTYFSEAVVDGSTFVDGALGANNPVVHVEEEAADVWCNDTGEIKPLVKCFISIGTGNQGIRSVTDKGFKGLLESLQREATETEATNQQFEARWRGHMDNGRCFRFNVNHGLEHVRMAEYQERDQIRQVTATYMEKRDTWRRVQACAENLRWKEYRPTPAVVQRMRQTANTRRLPRRQPRATAAELAELIAVGNASLKIDPDHITQSDLLRALQHFTKALAILKNNPSTSPKQAARIYQKLMETCLAMSQVSRDTAARLTHAEDAKHYGTAALQNVRQIGDKFMIAQVQFLLACVEAWNVYVWATSDRVWDVAIIKDHKATLVERLSVLQQFPGLNMEFYEGQAKRFIRYMDRLSQGLS